MNTITVNGEFKHYCEGCPFLDLTMAATTLEGARIYVCENRLLCDRLYRYLSGSTTFTTSESKRG